MFFVYCSHQSSRHKINPGLVQPVVKEMAPVVKTNWPSALPVVPLNKNQDNEKELLQTRLTKAGFSFFRDVIGDIVPALKNVE